MDFNAIDFDDLDEGDIVLDDDDSYDGRTEEYDPEPDEEEYEYDHELSEEESWSGPVLAWSRFLRGVRARCRVVEVLTANRGFIGCVEDAAGDVVTQSNANTLGQPVVKVPPRAVPFRQRANADTGTSVARHWQISRPAQKSVMSGSRQRREGDPRRRKSYNRLLCYASPDLPRPARRGRRGVRRPPVYRRHCATRGVARAAAQSRTPPPSRRRHSESDVMGADHEVRGRHSDQDA